MFLLFSHLPFCHYYCPTSFSMAKSKSYGQSSALSLCWRPFWFPWKLIAPLWFWHHHYNHHYYVFHLVIQWCFPTLMSSFGFEHLGSKNHAVSNLGFLSIVLLRSQEASQCIYYAVHKWYTFLSFHIMFHRSMLLYRLIHFNIIS